MGSSKQANGSCQKQNFKLFALLTRIRRLTEPA